MCLASTSQLDVQLGLSVFKICSCCCFWVTGQKLLHSRLQRLACSTPAPFLYQLAALRVQRKQTSVVFH